MQQLSKRFLQIPRLQMERSLSEVLVSSLQRAAGVKCETISPLNFASGKVSSAENIEDLETDEIVYTLVTHRKDYKFSLTLRCR